MNFTKRQIEIMEVSMVLVAKKGIQHLTTKNIAEAMHFTEPSIYRHFEHKTSILSSILYYYRNLMKIQLKEILRDHSLNSFDQLLKLLEVQVDHLAKNPAISVIIFSESIFQNDKVLAKTVKKIIKDKTELTINMIRKAQAEGVIRTDISAVELAGIYTGSMRFKLLQWKLSGFTIDLRSEMKDLKNSLITLYII